MDFHANRKAAQVGNQSSFLPYFCILLILFLRACFSARDKELAKELTQDRKEPPKKLTLAELLFAQQWRNSRAGSLLRCACPRPRLPGPNLVLVSVDKTLLAEAGTGDELDLSLGFTRI